MTRPFMFLLMIIPGSKNLGKKLNVFLRPLIDELKKLCLDCVNTYDIYRKENFQLRASLMWTISDFPAMVCYRVGVLRASCLVFIVWSITKPLEAWGKITFF